MHLVVAVTLHIHLAGDRLGAVNTRRRLDGILVPARLIRIGVSLLTAAGLIHAILIEAGIAHSGLRRSGGDCQVSGHAETRGEQSHRSDRCYELAPKRSPPPPADMLCESVINLPLMVLILSVLGADIDHTCPPPKKNGQYMRKRQ